MLCAAVHSGMYEACGAVSSKMVDSYKCLCTVPMQNVHMSMQNMHMSMQMTMSTISPPDCIVMVYIGTAYIFMAYIVMTYIVMVFIGMAT